MSATLIILAIVVITALAFDFTNGFHDTANAMATSIATGALKPFTAVAISAVLNLVGAFLSVNVAATVAKGIVNLDSYDMSVPADGDALLMVVFTGLIGGISWNLFTWLLGMPSSSSHALFGGLIGAAFAALGTGGVAWSSIVGKIIIPAVASPFIAAMVSACGTALVYWVTNTIPEKVKNEHFRHGQIVTACLVSLAHGTGDAQKTMGVIFLALVAAGEANSDARIPTWVIIACAVAIAAGTMSGGWRVIRTLGKGLVEIHPPQGMAAETSSAAIILTSSHLGMALSTTHVATGSIMGSGLTGPKGEVRWSVAGRMALAWITTLPVAAFVSFVIWWIGNGAASAGSDLVWGGVAIALIIALGGGYMFYRASKAPVHKDNVNEDWDEDGGALGTSADKADKKVYGEPADFVDTSAGLAGATATRTAVNNKHRK